MKITISAESTIDLPKELLDRYEIEVIPFTVLLGDQTYNDNELEPTEIINYVNKSGKLPKTTAVNSYMFEEHFKKLLSNSDAVIHVSLSSGISSTYQNAFNASKQLQNVYVIDSKSLSTGIALLAIYASELAKQGLSPEEIVEKTQKRREHLQVSFVLERLDYLFKGGRCSSLQAFGANILKLRVQILMKNDGKMCSAKKYRGDMTKCMVNYVKDTLEQFNTPDLTRAFITSPNATKEQFEQVKQMLIERGFKEVYCTNASATITSYCGEGTLGILYLNDGE